MWGSSRGFTSKALWVHRFEEMSNVRTHGRTHAYLRTHIDITSGCAVTKHIKQKKRPMRYHARQQNTSNEQKERKGKEEPRKNKRTTKTIIQKTLPIHCQHIQNKHYKNITQASYIHIHIYRSTVTVVRHIDLANLIPRISLR